MGIDHMGPYQNKEVGRKYIIIAIDYFTKYVEARVVKSKDSKTTNRFILEQVFL